MKKLLIALCIMMLMVTSVSSQTTSKDLVIPITETQLKTANLIFAEHYALKQEIPLLESKITNLETINSNWERVDSVRLYQLSYQEKMINEKNVEIYGLEKAIKRKNKWLIASGVTSVILAILCIRR